MTDWIATFPQVFNESQRSVLTVIEKAGFDKGLQQAARVAAMYALESPEYDALCREVAREILAEGGPA